MSRGGKENELQQMITWYRDIGEDKERRTSVNPKVEVREGKILIIMSLTTYGSLQPLG